jgi:hypothetical protein
MGGDVCQLTDNSTTFLQPAGLRGGSWGGLPSDSAAIFQLSRVEAEDVGFRVASVGSVPEPSTGLLAVLACGLAWWKRKSFRRVA